MRHGIIGHILCCAAALPAHAACTVAATPVAFGVYQSSAQLPTDSTGTVTVACGIFTSYSVSISAGVGGTNALNRALSSGGNRLAYNLYTDPTRILVWGDGTAGTLRVAQIATGATLNVFGRIPGLQNIASGSYADSLIVTIEF